LIKRVVLFWLLISQVLLAKGEFYRVVNVANDDVLNMREKDHYKSDLVGTLKPNEDCVEMVLDVTNWVIVKKDNKVGWVNRKFLKQSNSSCEIEKERNNDTKLEIFDQYEHKTHVEGIVASDKQNILVSIDIAGVVIIRELDTKEIILKKRIADNGQLKFSPNEKLLNIISYDHIDIYTFPQLIKVASVKSTDNFIYTALYMNEKNVQKQDYTQTYKVGNIKIMIGKKAIPNTEYELQSEFYYREAYYRGELTYQETIAEPQESSSMAVSQKENLVFFVDYNRFSKSSAIYAVNYKTGKEVWRVRGVSGAAFTGGSGDMMAYNKKEKLLYIVEDIEGGRVDVWDLEQPKKVASKEDSDYPNLPYKYLVTPDKP